MFLINVINEKDVNKIQKEVLLPYSGDSNKDYISSADKFITKLKAKLKVK